MNSQTLKVAVIGAAVSANKGAASMFYGLLDGLADAGIRGEITLMTTYPGPDESALQKVSGRLIPPGFQIRTANASPLPLVIAFLLALPIRFLEKARIGIGPLGKVPLIAAIRQSAVTVDLAGISFADGRNPALLAYNVVMSLLPYLAGGRVVKASQAIGPTKSLPTRTAAKLTLPRMTTICARGQVTRAHLESLRLDNVVDAADLAFLMHGWNQSTSALSEPNLPGSKRVVVMPSSVVDSYAVAAGIDHVGVIAELIDRLSDSGVAVVVAPHSFREGGQRSRMNDGPIVSDIEQRVSSNATFINRDLDPDELRSIIQGADVAITGRFHGMVSALEIGTPPVVIGWSHKYGEVLDQFNLRDQGLTVEQLSVDALAAIVDRTISNRKQLCIAMDAAREAVHASATHNIEIVIAAARLGAR